MKLTNKQKRFCEEYLVDFNGTQAAIRAGYSKKSANEQAARLLARPAAQEFIREMQAATSQKMEITREMVVAELAKIGFSNVKALYDENNRLKLFQDLPDDIAAAISSTEVDEIYGFLPGADGKTQIGETKKVKLYSKLAALETLCKILGFFAPEKKEISGEFSFLNLLQQSGTSGS